MKCRHHGMNGLLHYPLHRATPSGMHSTAGMVRLIIKKYGDAVGSGDTDTDSCDVCHHGVHTFKQLFLYGNWKGGEVGSNLSHFCAMHLMGIDEMLVVYPQQTT